MNTMNPFVVAGVLLMIFLAGVLVGAVLLHLFGMFERSSLRRERQCKVINHQTARPSFDPRYDPRQFRRGGR